MSPINFDFLISFQIDFASTLLTDTSWETDIRSVIYSFMFRNIYPNL